MKKPKPPKVRILRDCGNKTKLVRIDPDVLEGIKALAKENDRSIPRQINQMLRECIQRSENLHLEKMVFNESDAKRISEAIKNKKVLD